MFINVHKQILFLYFHYFMHIPILNGIVSYYSPQHSRPCKMETLSDTFKLELIAEFTSLKSVKYDRKIVDLKFKYHFIVQLENEYRAK